MKRIAKLLLGVSLCLLVTSSAFAGVGFSFRIDAGHRRPYCAPRYCASYSYGYPYCAPSYYYGPPPVVCRSYYYAPLPLPVFLPPLPRISFGGGYRGR